MRIKISSQDHKKLEKLLQTKENNIANAGLLNDLFFSLDSFPNLENVNDLEFETKTIEEIFDYFELDQENKYNLEYSNSYLKGNISLIKDDEFHANPYKNNVNPKEINENSYLLSYLDFPKYTFFPLDDIKVNEEDFYHENTLIGLLNKDYKYLTLSKNNNIWMAITPNEINTMKPHIKASYGNIITFGLGLGYFQYMVSLKQDVYKITILEKDKEIINLFSQYLLPLFPYKDKINIVNEDAFIFLNKNNLNEFDYAFFDLWHNAEDGLPLYLKIKSYNIKIDTGYWIEESLIALYRRCILTVIEESIIGYNDDSYRKAKNDIEKIINNIYFKTKPLTFTSYQQIHDFISKENILKLIE